MANNMLALQVKPWDFDYGAIAAQGENMIGARLANEGRVMDNALSRLTLDEAEGKYGALGDFRAARAAGDENALDALKAYPEMQLEMRKALDGMTDADRDEALRRGLLIADAARSVATLPAGSVERHRAWNQALDDLLEAGIIDDQQHQSFYDNPSDLVLDQALSMGQSLEQFIADRRATAKAKVPRTYGSLTLDEKLAIDKEARSLVEAGIPEYMSGTLDQAELQRRFEEARKSLLKQYGLDPEGAGPATPGVTSISKSDRTTPPPAKPVGEAKPIAPAFSGQPTIVGPNGERMVLSPDGKSWVPAE